MAETMGKKNPRRISIPSTRHLARISSADTIIYFRKKKNLTRCIAWGLVKKISKGDEFDMMYLISGGSKLLIVVIKSETARKQIATCKINQWCQIIADSLMCFEENETKIILYAVAIQGWYVPKIMDIRETPDEEKDWNDMDKSEYTEGQDFLSEFENN